MITILNRENLLQAYALQAMEGMTLDHFGLSAEMVEQCDLIVFCEGEDVKFLKDVSDIQQNVGSLTALMAYIDAFEQGTDISTLDHDNLRRRKR